MRYETFCGGTFETNCYLWHATQGDILFDAPPNSCDWLQSRGVNPKLVLLTHGHIDHILDLAKIKKHFACPIGCHPETVPMISNRNFFREVGFGFDVEPVQADILITETEDEAFLGEKFQVLEVPGHCPGSLCFFSPSERVLLGGDVLFAGGIGRWDLPGGDGELLLRGIKQKLFSLGDDVVVLPGHGPPTTIGQERGTNPFLC
jgi:glyoxylase-like metal-dependent hydrolase (beta-lactamase superfamily II)